MVPDIIIPLSKVRERDEWYIVHRRRPLGETDGINITDRMYFNKTVLSKLEMTSGGIKSHRPLRLTCYYLLYIEA